MWCLAIVEQNCSGGEKNIPEAAIDDEEDGDQERWHLTGVDQGIRPGEEEKEVYNYGFKK